MMKYLLAGAALAVIAAPVAARDNSAYFGIEVGPLFANDSDVEINNENFASLDHKIGVDGDLIAGYDFGLFRAELEGAYKWTQHGDIEFDDLDFDDADGHSRAYSLMGNAMVDFGSNENVNFYLGAGAGVAWVHQKFDISDAVLLPSGDLLVLERKFSLLEGVGIRIRRIALGTVTPGAVVDGPSIFEADLGQEIDNMEGIDAHVTPEGDTVLTMVSDDNFSLIQRTLLLQFTLVE